MSTDKMNVVGWFEIYVNDMERAKNFYENVFQQKTEKIESPDKTLEMWSFAGHMDAYGAAGALCKMEGVPAGGNSTMVYFSCADCAVEEARVAEFGGKVMKPKFSIGEHGFISLCSDSEDNVIGLHSMQ